MTLQLEDQRIYLLTLRGRRGRSSVSRNTLLCTYTSVHPLLDMIELISGRDNTVVMVFRIPSTYLKVNCRTLYSLEDFGRSNS